MKKFYLTLCVGLIGGFLMAQNKTTPMVQQTSVASTSQTSVATTTSQTTVASSAQEELPGFPIYQDTGNKELDQANYATAKQEWIKNNQAIYDKYLSTLPGSSSNDQSKTPVKNEVSKTVLTASDFNALPEARKNYVIEHPELFTVEK